MDQARSLYHQLVLIVASVGGGKTILLRELAQQGVFPLLNINLELSKFLLDMCRWRTVLSMRSPSNA